MSFFEKVEAWGKESQKGLLCGIFECNNPVEVKCIICKYGYCRTHKDTHVHSLTL